MKMSKKNLLLAGACLPLVMTAHHASADNRLQYSAADANTLTTDDNANTLSFTFSHVGRQGATLVARDPYSASERHIGGGAVDERGFNANGIHQVTGTAYDENGYDKDGYDSRGFNSEGIHKTTNTEYDEDGYNVAGFNASGQYMSGGMYENEGVTRNWTTYNKVNGKWVSESHSETTYPWRGVYDDEGYDANGFNRDGLNRDDEWACDLCNGSDQPWCSGEDYIYSATTYSNGVVSGAHCYSCFTGDTPITLADGSTKRADEITYDDDLLVWNFDDGKFDHAKPMWIKIPEIAQEYNYLRFSDGSVLKTINQHRIFNQEAGKFTYPMTDETPLGTHTFNVRGEMVTLVEKKVVKKKVAFYNIETYRHFNCFAGCVLTSCRLNNLYPIKDMKFVKDNREITPYEVFADKLERKWYDGYRLGEQPKEVNRGNDFDHGDRSLVDYVLRDISLMAKDEREDSFSKAS